MVIALPVVRGRSHCHCRNPTGLVITRERWVMRQSGTFRSVKRNASGGVVSGDISGLRPKWGRGYGRWVRDTLGWTKAPFLFREPTRPPMVWMSTSSTPDEVTRLGDHPVGATAIAEPRPSGQR